MPVSMDLKVRGMIRCENERRGRVRKEKMKRGTAFPTPYFFVVLSLVFFREWSFLYRARTKPLASQATCMTKAPLSLATALPSPPPYIVHRDLVGWECVLYTELIVGGPYKFLGSEAALYARCLRCNEFHSHESSNFGEKPAFSSFSFWFYEKQLRIQNVVQKTRHVSNQLW